jgi:prepilin-type processing-associated H-X9-DG protein/prepilin-type N-terminal cleavage/methylation domain-containing protein
MAKDRRIAFSLIELLVVIAIIAVLISLLVPRGPAGASGGGAGPTGEPVNGNGVGPVYTMKATFQVQPRPSVDCDPGLYNSPHSGGMNVALADGSVRSVSASISTTTWANACNPNDGQTLGNDWDE